VLLDESLESELSDEVLDDWVFGVDHGDLDLGFLWDEIHLSFSFFFLKSKRDSSDWSSFDSLHKMTGITSNLVSHSLGLDDGDIIDDSLVDVEILGQFTVVLLDDSSGGSLDGLGSYSTHFLEKWFVL